MKTTQILSYGANAARVVVPPRSSASKFLAPSRHQQKQLSIAAFVHCQASTGTLLCTMRSTAPRSSTSAVALCKGRFSTSANTGGKGSADDGRLEEPPLRSFLVRRSGQPSWTLLSLPPTAYVAELLEAAREKLGVREPVGTLTLHAVDEAGLPAREVVDSALRVEKALPLASSSSQIDGTSDSNDGDIHRQPLRLVLKTVADPSRELRSTGPALAELPDDHQISHVIAAIRGGKVTIDGDGHLVLQPKGLAWPVATNNTLFVRQFYKPLFENVLNKCLPAETEGEQRRIVTGQPGIGKSVWGWYVIFRILTEQPDRTVIYADYKQNTCYVLMPSGPVLTFKPDDNSLTDLGLMYAAHTLGKDPILVADSLLPPVLPFWTLVISSPGRLVVRRLKDRLNDYRAARHYMPIPSEEEVLTMRSVVFPTLTEADVRTRLQLWGPIPRLVLVKTHKSDQRACWREAAGTPLDKLIALARNQASPDTIPVDAAHRLVHERAAGQDAPDGSPGKDITSEEYYDRGKMVVASLSILRYLVERMCAEGKWNAAFLTDVSVGIGPLGALRGIKFEETLLAMLEQGATFKCRKLLRGKDAKEFIPQPQPIRAADAANGSKDSEVVSLGAVLDTGSLDIKLRNVVTFERSKRVEWSNGTDLAPYAREANTLLIPTNGNQVGFDALVWEAGADHHAVLDIAVAAGHGIHAGSLADAVTALGWTEQDGWHRNAGASRCPPGAGNRLKAKRQIHYFWAVPEDLYRAGWQEAQPPKEGSMQCAVARAAFKATKQFVLCVPHMLHVSTVKQALEGQQVALPDEILK